MAPDEKPDFLVLGDTIEAWLTAACLVRSLGKSGRSVAILPVLRERPSPPVAVLPPSVANLHALLGFDERDMLRFCKGSFRLGDRFEGWRGEGSSFVLSYGSPAEFPGEGALHQQGRRSGVLEQDGAYDTFSLGAVLGRLDRFAHPDPVANQQAGYFTYGYHLDADKYRDYLKRAALHYGVRKEEGDPMSILAREGELAAGVIVDATGGASISDVLPRDGWRADADLPFDQFALMDEPATSLSLGRVSAGNDKILFDVAAAETGCRAALFNASGVPENLVGAGEVDVFGIRSGHRTPWVGKCVSIGASAFGLLPFGDVEMSLIVRGVETLLELLPDEGRLAVAGQEYNRRMMMAYHRTRDVQVMAFALAARPWRTAEAAMSDQNRIRLEQFRSRGRVVTFDEECLAPAEWVSFMIGLGVVPERTDPVAESVAQEVAAQRLRSVSAHIAALAERYPSQRDYLAEAGVIGADAFGGGM
ncbi:MAG: tryptophan 7-halogenase [Hyphomonas sp.]|uniref:tryptophan 7-halogenase n=1 Tax=Hyphomonas sp. TaxID=87 RepID=UPI0035295F2F